jgi:hypothetical protein
MSQVSRRYVDGELRWFVPVLLVGMRKVVPGISQLCGNK